MKSVVLGALRRRPFVALVTATGTAMLWGLCSPLARAQAGSPATPAAPAGPGSSGPTGATLVPEQSEIRFVTRQMGVPVEGQFRRFGAQVALDPRQLGAARVSLSIDLASARIGTAETEAELAKPDWLHTAAFPSASFQSTAVRAEGPGRYLVSGRLSIKGAGRELAIPVTVGQSGGVSTATGSFQLQRLDFKIGEGEWKDTAIVANEVTVRFKLVLRGLAPL